MGLARLDHVDKVPFPHDIRAHSSTTTTYRPSLYHILHDSKREVETPSRSLEKSASFVATKQM